MEMARARFSTSSFEHMKIRLSVGVAIPSLIAFTLIIDVTSRFIPFLAEAAIFADETWMAGRAVNRSLP